MIVRGSDTVIARVCVCVCDDSRRALCQGGASAVGLEEGQTPPLLLVECVQPVVPQQLCDDGELTLL